MAAHLSDERRAPLIQIPRSNAKDPAVSFYANSNRQMRYQHLPDFDSSESDEQIESKLNERFEILEAMTNDIINQRARAMIASGPGGVGKTFTMDKALNDWDAEGDQYTSSSGYMTPVGLFRMLYKHRSPGDIIKLDDIDSIFGEEKSLNFIKIATDTTARRIITYASEAVIIDEETMDPIPRTFEFEGSLMYCTNLDFDVLIDKGSKLSPHLEAMITRSHYIDLGMRTKRDYLIRVFMVADSGLFDPIEGLLDEEKNDVLNFIEEYHKNLRECSLRMALKIAGMRRGASDEDAINWKRKVLLTCCKGVR